MLILTVDFMSMLHVFFIRVYEISLAMVIYEL